MKMICSLLNSLGGRYTNLYEHGETNSNLSQEEIDKIVDDHMEEFCALYNEMKDTGIPSMEEVKSSFNSGPSISAQPKMTPFQLLDRFMNLDLDDEDSEKGDDIDDGNTKDTGDNVQKVQPPPVKPAPKKYVLKYKKASVSPLNSRRKTLVRWILEDGVHRFPHETTLFKRLYYMKGLRHHIHNTSQWTNQSPLDTMIFAQVFNLKPTQAFVSDYDSKCVQDDISIKLKGSHRL